MTALPVRARAFGIDWAADIALPQFDETGPSDEPAGIEVRQVERLAMRRPIAQVGRGQAYADGFRFGWTNSVVFDVYAGSRIDYLPGESWRGVMPAAFFSTVAGLLLAGRGRLPFHASALELGGRAFLIAGAAGAGKSTLAAELLGCGARLIADDLTVLVPPVAGQAFGVVRGRPALRLHPLTAALVDSSRREDVPDDPRGKILVRPGHRADDRTFPLAGLVLLADGPGEVSPVEALRLLPPLLFRPRWCAALPGHGRRKAQLLELASRLPVVRLPPVSGFDAAARRRRIDRALAAFAAMRVSGGS